MDCAFFYSIFFIDKNGQLGTDIFLFKTIMIIVGGITGAIVIALFFKKTSANFLKQGIWAGTIWFLLNIILDLLVLIPMSKMSYPDYFVQIGLRYLMIPIMCILVGYLLENKSKQA